MCVSGPPNMAAPSWEEFRAYVASLPEGKAGWGFLRYEMLKRAGEDQLRVWYERVILPVVEGRWDPGRAVKEAELVLLDKGKERVDTLDSFRGIGLLAVTGANKMNPWDHTFFCWGRYLTIRSEYDWSGDTLLILILLLVTLMLYPGSID